MEKRLKMEAREQRRQAKEQEREGGAERYDDALRALVAGDILERRF